MNYRRSQISQDVLRCSPEILRCSQGVLKCFQMFSYVLRMFSWFAHDILGILKGPEDLMVLVGLVCLVDIK